MDASLHILSSLLSERESKNPSVCLKMLIPLNGSEIAGEQGGGAVVAEGIGKKSDAWRGGGGERAVRGKY